MTEPSKIRVLYFDESPETMSAFIGLCGQKKIITVAGAFSSFAEVSPALRQSEFMLMKRLAPDVLVFRLSDPKTDIEAELCLLRDGYPVKTVGVLCSECSKSQSLVRLFDYHISASEAGSFITDENLAEILMYKIKTARLAMNTESRGISGKWAVLPPPPAPRAYAGSYRVIAIGASAGGTKAVTEILSALPKGMPPILLVQHIPDNFTEFFAKNLASRIRLRVFLAGGGERLENGCLYIAGNDNHLRIVKGSDGELYTDCVSSEKISGHRPSVDVLFDSVAKEVGMHAIGVILTGMGSDGAQGLLEMRKRGAYTIGQDKETSAVYGMPMVAFSMGAVTKQLPLGNIANELIMVTARGEGRSRE